MAKEMKKKSPFLLNACFITPYPFCRFGSLHTATDGGGSIQQRRFCTAKTRVQKLAWKSIFERATEGGDSKHQNVQGWAGS